VATVLIIGASRGIGLETVKATLEAGHSVRALARSARRIPIDHPRLEKMAGDALVMATVKRALTGVDVVTQSLGIAAGPEIILKPTRFFSKATRVLHRGAEQPIWPCPTPCRARSDCVQIAGRLRTAGRP
jgi:NAD(P)-dependent dehydrogenase (short-subunit alcohol dehydrogenase family)